MGKSRLTLTPWASIILIWLTATSAPAGSETLGPEEAPEDIGQRLVDYVNEPWTGDLDGMLERGMIRALVVYSKTMYFPEKGRQRGIDYEMLSAFEKYVNKKFPPSVKHIKTHVAGVFGYSLVTVHLHLTTVSVC